MTPQLRYTPSGTAVVTVAGYLPLITTAAPTVVLDDPGTAAQLAASDGAHLPVAGRVGTVTHPRRCHPCST